MHYRASLPVLIGLLFLFGIPTDAQVKSDLRTSLSDTSEANLAATRTIYINRDESRAGEALERWYLSIDPVKPVLFQSIAINIHHEVVDGLVVGGFLQKYGIIGSDEGFGLQLEVLWPLDPEPFEGFFIGGATSISSITYTPREVLEFDYSEDNQVDESPFAVSVIAGRFVDIPQSPIPNTVQTFIIGLTLHANPTEAPITGYLGDSQVSPFAAFRVGFKF